MRRGWRLVLLVAVMAVVVRGISSGVVGTGPVIVTDPGFSSDGGPYSCAGTCSDTAAMARLSALFTIATSGAAWSTASTCCDWEGVACDVAQGCAVVNITNTRGKILTGNLTDANIFTNFSHLMTLDFKGVSMLSGSVLPTLPPSVKYFRAQGLTGNLVYSATQCQGLLTLDLNACRFYSPLDLASIQCPSLLYLRLNASGISGYVGGWATQLRTVSLAFNSITDFNYNDVAHLQFFDASHNSITSVVFDNLFGSGDLSYNNLACPVPANNYNATCVQTCAAFATPANGAVSGTCTSTARPGDRCYVSCNTGYDAAQPSWQCRYTVAASYGTWVSNVSANSPCIARDPYCIAPNPDIPFAHAYALCRSTPINSLCQMECEMGLRARETMWAVCDATAEWTTNTSCQLYEAYCPRFYAPANGYLINLPYCFGYLNASCGAACNAGYTLNVPLRTCLAYNMTVGEYDAPPFQCTPTPNYCPVYVAGNGTAVCDRRFNGTCSITCDTGYTLTGTTLVCGSAGTWQGTNRCTWDQSYCPAVADGVCNGRFYGASCTPSCGAPYAPQGSITCGVARTWIGTMSCIPPCPAIASTASITSNCATSDVAYGGSCQLTCTAPYQGTLTRTCGTSAAWSTPATPTCALSVCPAVAVPNGANYVSSCASSTVPASQACVLRCVAGLVGVASFTCPASGDWGQALSVACAPASCPAIPSSTSLSSGCASSTTSLGAACTLRCGAGTFNASATVVRSCVQSQLGVQADWSSNAVPVGCIPCDFTHCAGGGTCNPTTGAVTCGSCPAGWWGAACTQVCASPQGSCQQVASCDQTTGAVVTCAPCAPGSVCRNATGPCNAAVICSAAGVCPASNPLADGSLCVSGHACMEAEACMAGLCGGGAATGCCGSGTVEAGEGCDDGNRVSGDGCSSSCVVEAGWACLTPGAPCLGCPAGLVADCNQECGGTARIDGCGVCAGGATGRVANGTRDLCGVCGGGNAAVDDCGICFGNNVNMDPCGQCYGDGSTCKGCDGVPNSGKVPDACGICGGDNSTCMGCDGRPIPLGGKRFDTCGVCGGNNGVCSFDCRGIPHGASQWDCNGVCGGTAVLNACGVCVGGTTGRAPLAGICNGVCSFNSTCDCPSGVYDVCGVCDGDNSTCRACDNSTTHGVPAFSFTCGQCNVNGLLSLLACNLGCDGVQDSGKTYDCNHECGGAASPDNCGVCAGGLTGVLPGAHNDSCGVCFGGDRDKDLCGVCYGHNLMRDDCGICFGGDSHKDTCGICFGRDRMLDACGQCGGNGTWCLGCDSVPHSNMTRDACGVCGGNGICDVGPGNLIVPSSTLAPQTQSFIAYQAGGAAAGCLLALIILIIVMRRRKRSKIGAYLADAKDAALAAAPSGVITMVFTDIQGSTALWEAMPDVMAEALDQHNELIRALLAKHNGYEVKTEGDAFRIAFQDVLDAINFSVALQDELLTTEFPAGIEKARDASTEYKDGTLIRRGLRVRMGMSTGEAANEYDPRSQRIDYHGAMITEAQAVQSVASGGQIIISEASLEACVEHTDPATTSWAVSIMGTHLLKGISEPVTMYQIQSRKLAGRVHAPLRQASNVLMADTQRSSRSLPRASSRLLQELTARSSDWDTLSDSGVSARSLNDVSGLEAVLGATQRTRRDSGFGTERTVSSTEESNAAFTGPVEVAATPEKAAVQAPAPIAQPTVATALPPPLKRTPSTTSTASPRPSASASVSTAPAKSSPLARQASGVSATGGMRRDMSVVIGPAPASPVRSAPTEGWAAPPTPTTPTPPMMPQTPTTPTTPQTPVAPVAAVPMSPAAKSAARPKLQSSASTVVVNTSGKPTGLARSSSAVAAKK